MCVFGLGNVAIIGAILVFIAVGMVIRGALLVAYNDKHDNDDRHERDEDGSK